MSAFNLLNERHYRALWIGGTVSHLVRTAEILIGGYVVAETTGSPLAVAAVGFCRVLPFLFGPLVGLLCARIGRMTTIRLTLLLALVASLVGSLLAWAGALPIPMLAVIGFVVGIGWPVDWTVRRTLSADLVGSSRIMGAMVLEAGSLNVARIIGAPLGGLLLALGGPAIAYLVLAVLALISLGCFFLIAEPTVAYGGPPPLRAAFRAALRNGAVTGVLAVTIVMNLLVFPYQQLVAYFGNNVLGLSATATGLLASADGIGQVLGTIAMASLERLRRRGLAFLFGASTCAAGALLFSLSTNVALSFFALAVIGVGIAFFVTLQGTIPITTVQPEERLGVLGVVSLAIGSFPIGTFLVGFVGNSIGAPQAGAIAAGSGLVLILLFGALFPRLRNAERSDAFS